MARPKKGTVPPQLRKYVKGKKKSTTKRKKAAPKKK